ncbi:hypothetical protein E2C01_027905 [Portunus trituberculatus]|uniref:Uncharacterized protein n=1 Tax=Portunus trituberculatus TaxID=210409 RepID=A0A5B7ENG4_PORTR|nr:hypothetical protein [Portunus trituberculatus]
MRAPSATLIIYSTDAELQKEFQQEDGAAPCLQAGCSQAQRSPLVPAINNGAADSIGLPRVLASDTRASPSNRDVR